MSVDLSLRPAEWAPKPGSRVVICPNPKASADTPAPPPGEWVVIDRSPEPQCWWVMPHDGTARVWATVEMAGRPRDTWPVGWPGQQVSSRWLYPASMVTRALF